MSTINEALKELKNHDLDIPKDPHFKNVEFFPGFEGREEAIDFIYLNEFKEPNYKMINSPKLGGTLVYWNDTLDESFDEVELDTPYGDYYIRKNRNDSKTYDVYKKDNSFIEGGFFSIDAAQDAIDMYEWEDINESRLSAQEKDDIAKRAWMLNQVIWSMNDENAYAGSWLYLWPDETAEEDVKYYFNTRKDLKELEDLFIKIYKAYHKGGLYTDDEEIISFAHDMDKKLGLKPIDVISLVK